MGQRREAGVQAWALPLADDASEYAELRSVFFADSAKRLRHMRELSADLGSTRPSEAGAVLEELLYEAHTLRGGAAVVGLTSVRDAAASLESLVTNGNGRVAVDDGVLDRALARVESLIETEDLAAGTGEPRLRPAPGMQTALVVHVDDDGACRALVARLLERRPNVRLASFGQGARAIRAVRAECPDLVFLDLRLPDMSGWAVLRALRSDPGTRHVPVVVLSGDRAGEVDVDLSPAPLTARLEKPFELADFLELVDRYCPGDTT